VFETRSRETVSETRMSTVHQIWLQGEANLPSKYKEHVRRYRTLNPGNHVLWDDERIRKLLTAHYPHLLTVYDNYQFWVMRVDLAKYAILHRYGGFYVDMDTEPKASFKGLVPLTGNKPTFYIKTFPWYLDVILQTFLNNNFMYSPYPQHPLFALLIERARQSAPRMFYDLKIYYILNSVGPHFMMNVIEEYVNSGGEITRLEERTTDAFFKDEEAKSWLSKQWFDNSDKWILGAGVIMVVLLFMAIRHQRRVDAR